MNRIIGIKFPLNVAIEKAAISGKQSDYETLCIVLQEALKFAEVCRANIEPSDPSDEKEKPGYDEPGKKDIYGNE